MKNFLVGGNAKNSIEKGGKGVAKGFMKFAKGMGIGLAVGCVTGVIANQYVHSGKKGMKKTVGKALKNMSELAEELGEMF